MLREEIIEFLGEDWQSLNSYIKEYLHSEIHLLQEVNDEIVTHGGKMLRPIVALLVSRLVSGASGAGDEAVRVAVATELLHNATLLHDDVADDSPTRRGNPTLSSQIGAHSAVLVGDFWLARAMQVVMSTERKGAIAKVFSTAMTNLAEGEMLQLQKSFGEKTTREDYLRIIHCKTASLFETACEGAAITSGAGEEQLSHIKEYAVCMGIAFQIKDDILDYVGDVALGKPVGIDLKEQKITLPLLCAMEGSGREDEIRKMIYDIHSNPQYCEQIRTFVFERQGVQKAASILEEYIQKSRHALDIFPDCQAKRYLVKIAEYNTVRKS